MTRHFGAADLPLTYADRARNCQYRIVCISSHLCSLVRNGLLDVVQPIRHSSATNESGSLPVRVDFDLFGDCAPDFTRSDSKRRLHQRFQVEQPQGKSHPDFDHDAVSFIQLFFDDQAIRVSRNYQ